MHYKCQNDIIFRYSGFSSKCFVVIKFPALYLFAVLLFVAGSLSAQEEHSGKVYLYSYFTGNGEDGLHLAYSHDGYTWEALNGGKSLLRPKAGGDKLMRDPCIIRGGDGLFHMVWTVSWNEKGIGYARSKDLINWSAQQYIPVMEQEAAARNCWAPEIFYDEQEKEYMIFWATTITGLFPETQTTEDDGYNHRMYFTKTSDFENFSETALLLEPGFNVIDGTLLKHQDDYLMFIKDETKVPPKKNIRIVKSKSLAGGYSEAGAPITGAYWAEGPSVAKVGNKWIVYFDKYLEKQMGAVASTDLQNWEDISDQVSFPEGTRHGTVFTMSLEEFDQLKQQL